MFANESIHHIASRLRVARKHKKWSDDNPHNGVEALCWRMYAIVDRGIEWDANALIEALRDLCKRITDLDERIDFGSSHLLWLMNAAHNHDVMSFQFLKYLVERDEEYVDFQEAAKLSNEAVTTWRARVYRRQIVGAKKVGNRWVIPRWHFT